MTIVGLPFDVGDFEAEAMSDDDGSDGVGEFVFVVIAGSGASKGCCCINETRLSSEAIEYCID